MATDSDFIVWISNYGQIILFFAQIVFWLAVGAAAIWSTLIFRRLVNAKAAAVAPAEPATSPAAQAVQTAPATGTTAAAEISVDEFVD